MIICSASNIDLIQGTLGYGDNTEGVNITDWRISNTQSAIAGQSGVFNIFNSSSITPSISIVDSGTVGIGTVPSVSSASKMEIVGNVNITGAYNINNRNVIADTSNYILSTSNILLERINANSGGGSGSLTSGGNLTLSNNATSNTVLSIQNNFTSNYTSNYTSNVVTVSGTPFIATFADSNVPSTHAQVTDTPNDRYMIFTTANVNHTFTVPTGGIVCDILMIGGGGGGGGNNGGGGGAGACIVAINQTLPAGSCVVNVGIGGGSSVGGNSYIQVGESIRYLARGGGGGSNQPGTHGGCGGGASYNTDTTTEAGGDAVTTNIVNGSSSTIPPSVTSTYAVMGNAGGNNGTVYNTAGSGGGIGTVGVSGGARAGSGAYQVTLTTSPTTTINFRNYFANGSTSFGVQDGATTNYYIGGGGGSFNSGGNGGLGGGGAGGGVIGVANTGSGGGGGGGSVNNGASGIIIIRYRSGTSTTTPTAVSSLLSTPPGTPTIELIRGISGDNNLDYKLGNYDGNFKIMSSISNTDTDRLSISSSGAISLSNNATSNTVLSIANSNVVYGTIQGTSNYTSNVITETAFVATFADANVPSTHAQVTSSTDRYMIFTTASSNHTFTVPAGGLNCDILMIGGGGRGYNGGGGAGACIVAINQTLPSGSCVVVVGAGGATNSMNGSDSFIKVETVDRYRAKGGGFCPTDGTISGSPGGCGGGTEMYIGSGNTASGGAAVSTNVVNGVIENTPPRITSTYAVMGNAGGNNSSPNNGGSGGGIGTVGTTGGTGGNGAYQVTLTTSPTTTINFRNYFANGSTSFGVQDGATTNYYIGGGGGAYAAGMGVQSGGLGGGGYFGGGPYYGVANTGSGGSAGGTGGSGIIIIRYRSVSTTPTLLSTPITIPTATLGTPTIELIRGTQGDNNLDYKLGNYDGNFKIMSSISSIDTDRLSINSSTNSTALSIINRDFVVGTTPATGGLINALTTTGSPITSNIGTTDRYMIFTASGSFTVPTGGINCDILMIGGGGAGGYWGGGGGAGACIVAINQTLSTTGTYTVNVGAGDIASDTNTGAGGDSSIVLSGTTLYLAKGGGRGERANNGRNNGGCGGGSGWNVVKTGGTTLTTNIVNGIITGPTLSSTFVVLGNKGGDRPDATAGVTGAGGGGIGGPGGNHIISSLNAGPGGVGVNQVAINGITYNFKSYFAGGATFGNNNDGFIGGGGGGSVQTNSVSLGPNVGGIGGIGGGGAGGITSTFVAATGAAGPAINPVAGTANTGGGGGGGLNGVNGGSGGSGIVIVRYRIATAAVGVPSVELIRGVAGDSNHDYKVGNYDGNFKIMSSVSGATDAERINITSVGNVGIGTSSPANELHIFDSTTSATSLIIQNNNMMMTSNTTQGTSTTQATVGGFTTAATPTFTLGGPSTSGTITSSIDKFMIFTAINTDHTFTVPANFNCDILMIGGGGGGDTFSGGGAGACIVAINQTLPAGSCVVVVGAGGNTSTVGYNSFITVGGNYRYLARGGGFGAPGTHLSPGGNGGCGGGGAYNTTAIGGSVVSTNVVVLESGLTSNIGPCLSSTFAVMGNKGGDSTANISGSGGGIGTAGTAGGNGGNGAYQVTLTTSPTTTINFRNYFANGGTFGVLNSADSQYYIGGGGGSYGGSGYQDGGLGGGGKVGAASGVPNTGGGALSTNSGASGIVIIRYRSGTSTTTYTHTPTSTTTLSTTLGTPSIELVRGTQGDSNTDYKIGNYNGDFIVKSSTSSIDTDRFNITTAGNIGIGITNPAVKLQVVGGDFACSGDISAYYSDERLKTRLSNIKDPLEIIGKLNGFYYIPNDLARFYGITNMAQEIGLSAQEVNKVLPELVKIAPFDLSRDEDNNKVSKSGENYLTLSYDRLAPVFVEAIKELRCSNDDLNEKYNRLLERFVNDEKL